MDTNKEEVVSTQKSLQPSHDPGWNDPPSWAFSAIHKGDGVTKPKLNKRVAFPLSSTAHSSSLSQSILSNNQYIPSSSASFPSTNTTSTFVNTPHKGLNNSVTVEEDESNSAILIDKETSLQYSLENFQQVISASKPAKFEEIQKRLDKLKLMWDEDKLDNNVKKKILDISEALKRGDLETADRIHISLMVNNANLCSSWVPGIRQLISDLKMRNN